MRFTVAGSKIICSRKDNTVEDVDSYRQVVTFDAHLDEVPPHVTAKLTNNERGQLEQFLADREHIRAMPIETNILETLPELLEESTVVVGSVSKLDESLYRDLCSSVASLTAALQTVKPRPNGRRRRTPIRSMRESEALKERLENIKQDL